MNIVQDMRHAHVGTSRIDEIPIYYEGRGCHLVLFLPCLLAESNGFLINLFLSKNIIQNKEKGGEKIDALSAIAFKTS